ncbi:hypothetical protein RJZ56_003967 [Blastomyces dermatitidis]
MIRPQDPGLFDVELELERGKASSGSHGSQILLTHIRPDGILGIHLGEGVAAAEGFVVLGALGFRWLWYWV